MTDGPLLQAPDEVAALDWLDESLCTDGLPVVVPTPERVERMALMSGLDLDLSLGFVPPRGAAATIEMIAANAVMAGCLPDHFPVVLAAVEAVLEATFDLAEVQSTTNPISPLIIVNGPAALACRVASGHGALGPGHRANATIGRALRLVLFNLGGARPGEGDMALLGHGSKFSACFAEAEANSPFEPFHVSRGWEASDGVVTVVGCDAPQSVVYLPIDDDAASADMLLRLIAGVAANPAHLGTYSEDGCDVIVLNPDHAAVFQRAGFGRERVVAEICARATNEVGFLRSLNPSVVDMSGSYRNASDAVVASPCNPDRLILLVAGGYGAYSWVMRSWGVGPHRGASVTKQVRLSLHCDLPGMNRETRRNEV